MRVTSRWQSPQMLFPPTVNIYQFIWNRTGVSVAMHHLATYWTYTARWRIVTVCHSIIQQKECTSVLGGLASHVGSHPFNPRLDFDRAISICDGIFQASAGALPLAPRMAGFSSQELRLPPAAMLLSLSGGLFIGFPPGMLVGSAICWLFVCCVQVGDVYNMESLLSGKKSSSSLAIHWGSNSPPPASLYQNLPPARRSNRDTVF